MSLQQAHQLLTVCIGTHAAQRVIDGRGEHASPHRVHMDGAFQGVQADARNRAGLDFKGQHSQAFN